MINFILIIKPLQLLFLNQTQKNDLFFGLNNTYWTFIMIPILIPLIAFSLGTTLSKYIEKQKQLNNLKNQQDFISTWIDLIQSPIKKQSIAYNTFASNLKRLQINNIERYSLHLDKLKYIDSFALISLFVKNKKGNYSEKVKLLFEYENSVEALINLDASMQKSIMDINDFTKKSINDWNTQYKNIIQILQELKADIKKSEESEIIQSILNVFSLYTSTKTKNDFHFIEYVEVLGPLCSDYVNISPDDKIFRLLNALSLLKHTYNGHNTNCNELGDMIKNNSEKQLLIAKQLIDIKVKLNSLDFECKLKIKL